MDTEPRAPALYEALAKPFETTQTIHKAGRALDYLTTEQVVSRLTQVVGMDGWSFEVQREGRDGDVLWCVGHLSLHFGHTTVWREQFGECETQKGMGAGDARKGAASDALKKCASLFGVGLYLQEKDPPPGQAVPAPSRLSAGSGEPDPQIPLNRYGLPVIGVDPMTSERKASFLGWVKKKYDLDEADIVFAMGRPIDEWCCQQDTGYQGALTAFHNYMKRKLADPENASLRMLGAERQRLGVPTF